MISGKERMEVKNKDEQAELLHKAILEIMTPTTVAVLTRETPATDTSVMLYGLNDEPIPIPLSLARRILSQNEAGQLVKQNSTGSSDVVRIGQVFFKSRCGASALYPLVEQAVYQMNRQLGGGLVAPTRLLFLKMPNTPSGSGELIAVQASLAIEGVSLEDIICLPGMITGFKKLLGERFNTLFPNLVDLMDISGAAYNHWLAYYQYTDMPWERQCKYLLDRLYALPVSHRPYELKNTLSSSKEALDHKQREELERAEQDIQKQFRHSSPLSLLALIEHCPGLTKDIYLNDLLKLPSLLRLIRRLYPRLQLDKIADEAEHILKHFEIEDLHRHLLLALLTEPKDHKGDNLKVVVRLDEQGNLLPFKVIAIDNDYAFEGTFKKIGKKDQEEHLILIKTLIHQLNHLRPAPLSTEIVKLLSKPPEALLLSWLHDLSIYYQRYHTLLTNNICSKTRMEQEFHLQQTISSAFIARLKERLESFQKIILSCPTITSEELFLSMEPLLGRYYQALARRYPDPQLFVIRLYNHPPTLEKLLGESLQTVALRKTLAEMDALVGEEHSYEETMDKIIQTASPTRFQLISPHLPPSLCQSLLTRNRELAWQLALQKVSQEATEKVCLETLQGRRYLCPEVYQQIFGGGVAFPKTIPYGRHPVTAIQCKIAEEVSVGLHLKHKPGLAGREIMVQVLASHLFGSITPHIALWRFVETRGLFWPEEVAYPVLASRSIVGKPLNEVFESHPSFLTKLDVQSVQEAIILAMLVNPEDGRADNYIVEPFSKTGETAYRLISIDNDQSFVSPIQLRSNGQEIEGANGLRVKTILYCLDEMKKPLLEALRNRLLALEPHSFLKNWLETLQRRQEETEKLFNESERTQLARDKIYLDIPFESSIVTDLYQKLLRLQTMLRQKSHLPLMGLLRHVIPSLGVRYNIAFERFNTPQARFAFLTKDQFERVVITGKTGEMSVRTSKQIVDWTPRLRLLELNQAPNRVASLKTALEALKQVSEEHTRLRKILNEVQSGDCKQFRELLNSDNQERIVNGEGVELPGINFATMRLPDSQPNIGLQKQVLDALMGISFRSLKLHDCAVLTDTILGNLLMSSSGLLTLDIQNCPQLTQRALKSLSDFCPAIEKLGLRELPALQRIVILPFFKLRVLKVRDCKNLSEWTMMAPTLVQVEFNYCEQLVRVSTQSLILRYLKLINCSHLPTEQLTGIILRSEHVRSLRLSNCPLIPEANFYITYPQLINLPLHQLPLQMVTVFKEKLDMVTSEIELSPKFLTVSLIDVLQQSLLMWIENRRKVIYRLQEVSNNRNIDLIKLNIEALEALVGVPTLAAEALIKLDVPTLVSQSLVDALLNYLDGYSERSLLGDRASASQALGKLVAIVPSMRQKSVLNTLLECLSDREPSVRDCASEALGKFVTIVPPLRQEEVVNALLKGLSDGYPNVRACVSEVLGKFVTFVSSVRQEEVVNALLKGLSDREDCVRTGASEALGKLVAIVPSARQLGVMSALLKCLIDSNSYVRIGASEALGKFVAIVPSERQLDVMGALLKCLSDKEPSVRVRASEALGKFVAIIPSGRQLDVMDALLKCLNDREHSVRACASESLGKLAVIVPPARQEKVLSALLQKSLSDSNYHVRTNAVEALSKISAVIISTSQVKLISWLLKSLSDGDPFFRVSVAEILGKFSVALTSAGQVALVSVLLKSLSDEQLFVRAKAVETVGKLSAILTSENQADVVSVLLKSFNDKEAFVRVKAVEALGKLSAILTLESQGKVLGALLDTLNHNFLRVILERSNSTFSIRNSGSAIKTLANILTYQHIIDSLIHTFKAAYQKEFASNKLLKEYKDKEEKSKLEQATLIGKLGAETVYFSQLRNDGVDNTRRPGSCGFISLGVTREQVFKLLVANLDNPDLQKLVGEQIYNDFQTARQALLLSDTHKKTLDTIVKVFSDCQERRNNLIKTLKEGTGLKEATEDELIKHYTAANNPSNVDQLQKIKAELARHQDALNAFLRSRALVEDYINQNIRDEWLGAYVALAWAKLSNRTLRIWRHQDARTNSREILLLENLIHTVASDNQPIDIIHTENNTHYERLQRQPAPTNTPVANAAAAAITPYFNATPSAPSVSSSSAVVVAAAAAAAAAAVSPTNTTGSATARAARATGV